ncbi:hypothetical protein [Terrimonas alba]|uniref:hypothetical protein n=1 Tax=Terrimonas alba TaxID=3349636 RepID=UPI0035F42D2A
MDGNLDNLKRLIESVKTISFWGRLFGWRKIRTQLVDASADLQKLISNTDNLEADIYKLESTVNGLSKDLQLKSDAVIKKEAEIEKLNEKNTQLHSENKRLTETSGTNSQTISDLTKRKSELDIELAEIKRDLQNIQTESGEVKKQNTQLLKDDEFRKQEHSNSLASLERIQNQIQAERNKEVEERNAKELERIKKLKETWAKHQENAKSIIKSICQKHTIQYIDKVSFKGDPDNTLLICNEYIVFDAKSPGSDDLTNFPNYLKDQAEKAKKYAKQESVKSDIFFVVPSNTLDFLTTFVYRHGDHNVYIISVDALEPIILGLKKIEEYEFAEQLSPEDRENICRVLGRFAHLSKRRIQVDSFFAKQFIELAYKCETDLPKDILDSVIEFEKAEKLNPPQEKRVKTIPIGDLDKESKKIKQEAESRGILIEDENISNSLNELPLYKK